MPRLSLTERQALTAGNVGWEGELFSGMPDWDKLKNIPKGKLSTEEQAFLEGPVEELCGMINDWDINQRWFTIPDFIWEHLKHYGFFGLIIPKKYGGKEFSALAHTQILTKISSVSIAVAVVVSVPNSLGPAELLLAYGTEEQKNYYLPRLAKSEEIPCFALTSPVAGSDAGSIEDYGIVCHHEFNGKRELAIRLNWDKRYITLAPIATLIGIAFKLYDPDHLIGDRENLGITCALIPVNTPGVVTGRRHFPLCCAFPNGPTQGKDVIVPLTYIIGGVKMAGRGWRMLMERLAAGRSISVPSLVSGRVKWAVYMCGAYARIRRQFHLPIGKFGGVQEALTRIGSYTFLIEALRLFTISSLDRGFKSAVASAITKYHITQLSREVISHAMDIHGGKGICMGPNNYLAQGFIESPLGITVEGANILTRSLIIFGQGAIRCHPYLLKEMIAASEKDLKAFEKAIFAHMGYVLSNQVRAFFLAISKGYFARVPHGKLRRYYQQFSQFSAAFAFVSDMVMLMMGGELKRKERLSGRLSDVLSYLYIGSAVMKYYDLENEEEMTPLIQWVCESLLYRTEKRLNEFLVNLPNRWLASYLRFIIFPFGKRTKPPTDKLGQQVAELFLYPSRVRERLAQHAYTRDTPHNPIRAINSILKEVIAAEPLQEKLNRGLRERKIKGKTFEEKMQMAQTEKIITSGEAEQLRNAYAASMRLINVDDFRFEELSSRFAEEELN